MMKRRDRSQITLALARAMVFIRDKAECECYVMCSCQDEAKQVLEDIEKIAPGVTTGLNRDECTPTS